MSVHHVRTEELPPRALPQLEARGDGGALHVRHSAESLRDLHGAGGLLPVASASFGPDSKQTQCKSGFVRFSPLSFFLFFKFFFYGFTEEGSADSLPVP